MIIRRVSAEEFMKMPGPILDVRSPGEFADGHIPAAESFPLFDDEERARVGICYKEQGRSAAIELGFDIVGPRLGDMVRRASEIAPEKTVRIHCWRGGMRSKNVAWLLQTAGFRVVTLEGGYKSYRRRAREIAGEDRGICILSGLTGTGKTRILRALAERGEQVLDLEGLANHRGSSFGGLGMKPQPTTQQFGNLIAETLAGFDTERRVWIEAESQRVGTCWVPEELFALMKNAPVVEIRRSVKERLDILTEIYGAADPAELIEATGRIRERLGGKRTQDAVEAIRQGDFREACRIILDYYDRSYRADFKRRDPAGRIKRFDLTGLSDRQSAERLIEETPAGNRRFEAKTALK
jgi:tRNA 2-selenouridine synthase